MLRPNLDGILREFTYVQEEEQPRDHKEMGPPGNGGGVQRRWNWTALDRGSRAG